LGLGDSMLRCTPAEIFGCAIDKPIEKLKQLLSHIKDLDLSTKPPYNAYFDIFRHCVIEHGAWTYDLIRFHLGTREDAEKFNAYTDSIIKSAPDTDFEFVIENLFHTRLTIEEEKFNDKIKAAANGDLKEVTREHTAMLGKILLERNDATPLMDMFTLLTTDIVPDTPKKTLGLNLGFDEHMEGGLHDGELFFVIAPTGGGKSTIMLYECIMAIMQGHKAVYISLEMSPQLVKKRLRPLIKRLNIPEEALRRLHIKQFPTKSVTLDEVMALVDSLDVDMMALDYLDLLKMGGKGANPWLDLEELTAYFRGQLVERELMGITGSQVSEKNDDLTNRKRIIQLSDVRASLGKVYTSDYAITVTPLPFGADSGANVIIFLAKNRRGQNVFQPARIDFADMSINPILGVTNIGGTSIMDMLTGGNTEGRR
jgi:hypothetical protein